MKELAAIANEAGEARLRFLIIGGLAVNAYGHARTTYDADFMIPRRDLAAWKALLLIALKLHALKHGPVSRRDKDLPDIVELVRLEQIDIGSAAFTEICAAYGTKELQDEIRKRIE